MGVPATGVGLRARLARLAVPCLAVLVALVALVAAPAGAVAQEPGEPKLPPMDVVVLVDESESLSPEDVEREKAAARTIAGSILAPGSTIEVVGFASADRQGQSAVDLVCPRTPVDTPAQADAVAVCIDELRIRGADQGNDTDHVTALRQAYSSLRDSPNDAKIVFLMTDGVLEVPDSAAFGRDLGDPARTAEARRRAALDQIPAVLRDIDGIGAQVWPLGFGKANADELRRFGAGRPCAPTVPAPEARVIADPAQLTPAMLAAFSSATCVVIGSEGTGTVNPGDTDVTIPVEIPEIASNSAILVEKRDPRIQVQYVDPSGNLVQGGSAGESSFTLAGQGTANESLRIVLPEAGTWTVRLSSAADVPTQQVTARVVHQLAVSAVIGLTPPLPLAGQDADVSMQLRSRRGAVTDAALLKGLTFTAALTANGRQNEAVTLVPAGDGVYSGTLAVPADAVGDLAVTGTVVGPGIGGDAQIYPTRVRPTASPVAAQIVLRPAGPTVAAGDVLPAEVSVTNSSGAPVPLRLELDDLTEGARVTVDPATVTAAPGSSTTPFVLRFAPDSPLGGVGARLRLVDESGAPVAERVLSTTVAEPPSLPERVVRDYWWALVAVAVVLAAVVAWLLMRARSARRAREVRGLKVELYRAGAKVHELTPRRPDSDVFRFLVHRDGFTDPQLQETAATGSTGEPPFELRRGKNGLTLTPEGPTGPVVHPGEPRSLSGDVSLVVLDNTPAGGAGTGFQPTQSWGPGSQAWENPSSDGPRDPVWNAPAGSTGATDDWSPSSDPWGGATPRQDDGDRTVSTRAEAVPASEWSPTDDPWSSGSGSGSATPNDPYDPWR